MYNDNSLLFGIILGICFSAFILLLVRDIIIRHFLNGLQVVGKPIVSKDMEKMLDPKFIEKAEEATIRYAKVLVEARNALEILIRTTEPTEETKEFFANLQNQIQHMDEELNTLAEMGIVERKE